MFDRAVQYNRKFMVLLASCPYSVLVTMGELQTQNQIPRHSPGLGGSGHK